MELHGIPTKKTTRFTGTGQEPFNISKDEFAALFRPRRTSIKAALLNQKLLHGVGNIYADESLFRAGIRPRRMAMHLKRAELDRLHAALQTVLREAIALGGSSVSDYVDAAGVEGFFQLRASGVYANRAALPGLRYSDSPHRCRRPGNPLLSPLPTLDFYEFQNDCPREASINRKQPASWQELTI